MKDTRGVLSPVQILRKIQAISGSVEQEICLKTKHFSALMLSTEIETAKESTDIQVTIHESELHFFQSWEDFLLNAF